ncbi:aminoacyl-tRNA hydrolase [Paenibacillus medicaginis]|uniref:peptidyl-tRNA hydrolase n=1 Tax=Paenibacillus medicaginis TaxID=1470560 RepID=A0ABV5BV98_9BACL
MRTIITDEIVQYYVVNKELEMSAGKVAAQVAHVADKITYLQKGAEKYEEWHSKDHPKIILVAKEKELRKLIALGWVHVIDNGRTEIPSGSLTVVGCKPDYKSVLQPVVKRYQLYR